MPVLEGKTAIVTGASSGIGRAASLLFAREGANVVLTARRAGRLHALVDSIRAEGARAVAVPGDVTNRETHDAVVAVAEKHFGGLDIAFNNAGTTGPIAPLAEIDPADWQTVLATNLTSAYLGARAQIPAMLRRGRGVVLFTSSFVGNSAGLPGMGAYGATKAGLIGLVRGLTADYAASGIRANAVLPGGTDTEMAGDDRQRSWAAGLHAMKRIASADEIAEAALFLASDRASFVTGTSLWVDGGNSAVKI